MVFMQLANVFRGTRGMQYAAVVIVSLASCTAQTVSSWLSPSIPILTGDNSPLGKPLTPNEISWLASTNFLASIPCAVTYHITMARIGQRQLLFVTSVTWIMEWVLILFGNHAAYIFAAKVLDGLLMAAALNAAAIYCADISDPDIRGRLGTIYITIKILGSVLVLSVGPFVSYRVLPLILIIIPSSLFCLLFFIPESPYFLVKMNKLEDARDVVQMLSGSTDEKIIDEKLQSIIAFVNTSERQLSFREVFSNRTHTKAIMIVLSLITLQTFSGFTVISAYQQTIIEGSQSFFSPEISSIMFGVIQIPAALISAFLVDRLGRKIILYIGCTGTMVALIVEGIYFYLQDYEKADVSSISWIPTTGLMLYLIMHAVHAAIPTILLGEFFTFQIKDIASTCFGSTLTILLFVSSKTYQPLRETFGVYSVMWIYAGFNFATIVMTYFFLIETKNKSFEEIKQKIYK